MASKAPLIVLNLPLQVLTTPRSFAAAVQAVDAARTQALPSRDAQTLAAAWQLHRMVAVSLRQAGLSQQAQLDAAGLEVQAAEAELVRGLPLPSLEPAVLQAYLDSLAVNLSAVQVSLVAWLSGCPQLLGPVVPLMASLMRAFTGLLSPSEQCDGQPNATVKASVPCMIGPQYLCTGCRCQVPGLSGLNCML